PGAGRATTADLRPSSKGNALRWWVGARLADRESRPSCGAPGIRGDGAASGRPRGHRGEPFEEVQAPERRRNVLLLRWLSIITTSYLLLLSPGGSGQPLVVISILLLLLSNVVLQFLPERLIFADRTLFAIVLVDTSLTSIAVLWLATIEPDVLIFYFFVILQAAVGRSFRSTLVAAVATSALALVLNRDGSP